MDAAIVKTKMGANAIRGIAFAALPLPEAKNIDATPIPVLPRDVVPESNFFFDALETGILADQFFAAKEKKGEINRNIVPVEIPTERKETVMSTTIKNGVVAEVIIPPAVVNTTEEAIVLPTTTTTITTIIEDELVTTKKVVKDGVANTTITSTTTTNPNATTKVKNITTYPTTDAEIRAFQESKGLKADGVIGPKTEAALSAAGIKNPSSISSVAKDLAGAATATGTTVATFATDTVDAGANIVDIAFKKFKSFLQKTPW
jgi:hypothetical protein